ncbi:phage holin [Virgibacillus pantothenticus]|uniref:Holin n=2 Tax=Virgibacillus pantothenticus TaxID=1473 RepID=A0A0L0QK98_VIRPA|nr:phage holin [Virgibacillus pantothenticus]KNE19030.1 holin [Virgibacillus pantothenticus]KNE22488.1 holin [Virgibacillus pantothenticus]MED3737258.1 phage holin [Virgibacillus pantothenticus]QTY15469.1 phage holin [Virgibacillus pantothenticus]QTY16957.1 phage holin [Virgibacillus pantothenticus]
MKINWKVRAKKKSFWLALVPAIVLLIQIVGNWFGYDIAAELINAEAAKFINAVFAVLVILGIVNDPTTKGLSDSKQARHYKKPRDNA